jgi:tRNA uridine 5-carboxymethylaminomethyl modification enzyme
MSGTRDEYQVIVIGGGHAGAEAAWAAANVLRPHSGRVALVTMDVARIGAMSCNPAIGGLAKGQMVREIDALGGLMALAADATGIQFRVLNASKGPAVRGPRCQSDKYRYADEVQRLLRTRANLDILAGVVDRLAVERGRIVGLDVRDPAGAVTAYRCPAVVLTTGTFMRALMHTGEKQTQGGRVGEGSAVGISAALTELGFELGRLKTGTPPRLAAESIDFASLPPQPGDEQPTPFSDMTLACSPGHEGTKPRDSDPSVPSPLAQDPAYTRIATTFPVLEQRTCWLTETNHDIHERIRANLHRAPMYNGQIQTAGPRYCPSIEDKVVRFADRTAHHVFLEPESLSTNEIYCNGISTSLPADVQEYVVRHMPGCANAVILRPGYAVEYDMVWPHQIDATGMTKRVEGLFLAGQINGTSGYEEAAAQGLIAGLNAARFVQQLDLVRLRRDQAYAGVLMDDLVTKTPREPYRMFTSRAEHRLLLRADNTDERLTPLGRQWGLVDDARWRVYEARQSALAAWRTLLTRRSVEGRRLIDWARRPEIDAAWMMQHLNGDLDQHRDPRLVERVITDVQYEGYVARAKREMEQLAQQEAAALPGDVDYSQVQGLRREAAIVLNKFRPTTLGQAGRLAGVTPADLMVVSVSLGRR